MNKQVIYKNLGKIDFSEAWSMQEKLMKEVVDKKTENRDLKEPIPPKNYLLSCEHPHVYTLGKSGSEANLLLDENDLKKQNISYYKINRGGDITYHGPGQLVIYPILDLDQFFTDINKYLRSLEEAVILTLKEYNIKGERLEEATGVWLDTDNSKKSRKICAIGVRCSRWVTMHGLALNINTDLDKFTGIVPCGIGDKAVTSLQNELDSKVDINEVERILVENIANIFGIRWESDIENRVKT
ncbi:MAG: lipoyl(octanoyl) transferase LipB [Flavobacteriales bacterium]